LSYSQLRFGQLCRWPRQRQILPERCPRPSASMFVHIPYNEASPDKRNKAARYKATRVSAERDRFRQEHYTYQAKLPTNATNLSRSFAPAQLSTVQPMTTKNLKIFFCHFTFQSNFPLRVKSPFSMIRTAGKSCSGTESRIASEYRNCTACVRRDEESRFLRTTVLISDPKVR